MYIEKHQFLPVPRNSIVASSFFSYLKWNSLLPMQADPYQVYFSIIKIILHIHKIFLKIIYCKITGVLRTMRLAQKRWAKQY